MRMKNIFGHPYFYRNSTLQHERRANNQEEIKFVHKEEIMITIKN